MQGLNDIVNLINYNLRVNLLDKSKKFPGYKLFGVTQPITAEGQTFPGIFEQGGRYAGIDDRESFILYHKAGAVTIAELPRSGYGDSRTKYVTGTYGMNMIVWFNPKTCCINSDEILLALMAAIPESLDVADYSAVNLRINSAILNQQQVFQNEYKGVQYFLNPESSLLSIGYTIEGRFRKDCFNFCP